MSTRLLPSGRALGGWVLSAVLAVVLVSLVLAPAPRTLPAFALPATLALGDGGTLAGAGADLVARDGTHLPMTYRYRYLPPGGGAAAEDIEVLAVYLVQPSMDAPVLPELFAARPWKAAAAGDQPLAANAGTLRGNGPDRAWLRTEEPRGVCLLAWIAPDGRCEAVEQPAWRIRLDQWRRRPWQLAGWPFSGKPEANPSGICLRMTVRRMDGGGNARSPEDTAKIWTSVVEAFGRRARQFPMGGEAAK